jgi:hypothetical protein
MLPFIEQMESIIVFKVKKNTYVDVMCLPVAHYVGLNFWTHILNPSAWLDKDVMSDI